MAEFYLELNERIEEWASWRKWGRPNWQHRRTFVLLYRWSLPRNRLSGPPVCYFISYLSKNSISSNPHLPGKKKKAFSREKSGCQIEMPLFAFVICFTDVDFFSQKDSFSQPFLCLQKFLVSNTNQLEICQRNVFWVLRSCCTVACSSPRGVFYLNINLICSNPCSISGLSKDLLHALPSPPISLTSSFYQSPSFTASSMPDLLLFYKCRNGDVLICLKSSLRTFFL